MIPKVNFFWISLAYEMLSDELNVSVKDAFFHNCEILQQLEGQLIEKSSHSGVFGIGKQGRMKSKCGKCGRLRETLIFVTSKERLNYCHSCFVEENLENYKESIEHVKQVQARNKKERFA